jgi:hypothetical protein
VTIRYWTDYIQVRNAHHVRLSGQRRKLHLDLDRLSISSCSTGEDLVLLMKLTDISLPPRTKPRRITDLLAARRKRPWQVNSQASSPDNFIRSQSRRGAQDIIPDTPSTPGEPQPGFPATRRHQDTIRSHHPLSLPPRTVVSKEMMDPKINRAEEGQESPPPAEICTR